MDDLVVAAEVRVLVRERVEAVRAARDDLLHAGLVRASPCSARRAIWNSVLVAHAPGRVAGAATRAGRGWRSRRPPPAAASPCDCAVVARALVERRRRSRPSRGPRAPGRRAASTRTSSPSAQSARSACGLPHGFAERSTSRSIVSPRRGSGDSAITRWRRRSTMWSTCSIATGHSCTQAPQVTQSHTTSSVTALGTSGGSSSPAAEQPVRPSANSWSRRPMISSFGREILAGRPGGADVLAAAALGAATSCRASASTSCRRACPRRSRSRASSSTVEVERLEPAARGACGRTRR